MAGLDTVAATGAIPLVTWSCGDTDADVAAGLDDQRVTRGSPGIGGHRCAGPPALVPRSQPAERSRHGVVSRRHPSAPGYVAAYQHIRNLFASAGATNVAFVWSVDTSGTADPDLVNYYPGESVVDWIAAHGARPIGRPGATGRRSPAEFRVLVRGVLDCRQAAHGVLDPSPAPGSHSAYLGQILSDLPSLYPQIKSLIYFDVPDPSTGVQYQLDAAGAVVFPAAGRSSGLHPRPSRAGPTTVSVSPSSVAGRIQD